MNLSLEALLSEASATGFRAEILEKVIHLLNLLRDFQSHPYLKGRLALKGGTALNLARSVVVDGNRGTVTSLHTQ